MRYANPIRTLALYDLPKTKERGVRESYFEKIFRQLLVFDQLPDNNFQGVLDEAVSVLGMKDPAFEILESNQYQRYIQAGMYLPRWLKIVKDHYYFMDSEAKRRNKDNPYYTSRPKDLETWDLLPDFSKQKRNMPYHFDHLYRDAQRLAGEVYELTKNFRELEDKDLLRAKVNSILVPYKIIFALNSAEQQHVFAEIEISVLDIKIGLDALKQAQIFLNRLIESLHKINWSAEDKSAVIESNISLADEIMEKLRRRIFEMENKFILYMSASGGEE